MDRFYITTPIYYSNDVPHIGHSSTTVYADIMARFNRLVGKEVLFTTGNDEHGEKVYLTAQKGEVDTQKYVDDMALKWEEMWKDFNISYDFFVRTSNKTHKEVVQELLTKLYNKNDIYKAKYKGIYCVGCEEFKTERQLVNGFCPMHRKDQISEREVENYFFKLSNYSSIVKNKIESDEIKVSPDNKRKEILSRLDEEVRDLSISREKEQFDWGISIPWDNTHTIYVWVEALMNYYTNVKILKKEEFWPANVHFMAKDIMWFHSVIWPSLLLALDLPLPKQIFAHGFYNAEGGLKMSKSLGNVISPQKLIERYGVDGTRYLLCFSMPYENDSEAGFNLFDKVYTADLVNGLGNLVSRTAKLAEIFGINALNLREINSVDLKELLKSSKYGEIEKCYSGYRLNQLIEKIEKLINDVNVFINEKAPWKDADKTKAKENVINAINQILEISLLLTPIMPSISSKIINVFDKNKIVAISPLFERIKTTENK